MFHLQYRRRHCHRWFTITFKNLFDYLDIGRLFYNTVLCAIACEKKSSLCIWDNSVEIVITLFLLFRCVCFHLQRCYKQIWQKSPLSSAGGVEWGGGWWLGGDWGAGQRLEPERRTVSRLSVSAHLPPSAHLYNFLRSFLQCHMECIYVTTIVNKCSSQYVLWGSPMMYTVRKEIFENRLGRSDMLNYISRRCPNRQY